MRHPLPLSYATRREVVERVVPLYQEASLAQKVHLLDQVVAVTGYTRTYAIHLLNHTPPGQRTIQRRRPSRSRARTTGSDQALESGQAHLCQTLDPVFIHADGNLAEAGTSASERGVPTSVAGDEPEHR